MHLARLILPGFESIVRVACHEGPRFAGVRNDD
jgi:hypothetical protein